MSITEGRHEGLHAHAIYLKGLQRHIRSGEYDPLHVPVSLAAKSLNCVGISLDKTG